MDERIAPMSEARWERIQELFKATVDRPEGERTAYLAAACGDDAALRAEVEALLIHDAAAVVARYFPRYRDLYARLGWTMFPSIDRVYDSTKAARRLGFVCRTGFAEKLAELEATLAGEPR